MYVIEIEEDKVDNMMEHIGKSIKCLHKVVECLEDMKSTGHQEEDDEDYDYEQFRGGGRRMYRDGGREMYRGGGRYNRY